VSMTAVTATQTSTEACAGAARRRWRGSGRTAWPRPPRHAGSRGARRTSQARSWPTARSRGVDGRRAVEGHEGRPWPGRPSSPRGEVAGPVRLVGWASPRSAARRRRRRRGHRGACERRRWQARARSGCAWCRPVCRGSLPRTVASPGNNVPHPCGFRPWPCRVGCPPECDY
jgi:hypothetical protein